MKACAIQKYGGIEELKVEEISMPEPNNGEVLVEVHSASLNHLDIWVRQGARGSLLKFPHIIGSDASGTVKDTGEETILYPGISCRKCKSCQKNEETECPDFGIIGMTRYGTFAEYITVPADSIFPKPKHMNFEEASAFPLTFLTAWRMLTVKAKIKPKETVLIHGIGGGIAIASLILAKSIGAKVIVTSSSDEKLKKAGTIGADYLINYKTSDIPAEIKKITNSKGTDAVIDSVGASTWEIDFECVRKGGRIVLCGVTTGIEAKTNLRTLYWKQISIFGSTMGSRNDFKTMLDWVNTHKLIPVVDSIFPLAEIRQASEKMEQAGQFGKIVLQIKQG